MSINGNTSVEDGMYIGSKVCQEYENLKILCPIVISRKTFILDMPIVWCYNVEKHIDDAGNKFGILY